MVSLCFSTLTSFLRFTHHNDIFFKNGRRDYPYGGFLSKIRSKQVHIHLFSSMWNEKIFNVVIILMGEFFQKKCRKFSYGVTLSKIWLKQVSIRLLSDT